MRDFIRRIRQLIHWRRFDDDLAEEMALHRDMAAREREQQGIDPNAAVRAAHRTFGSGALAADQAGDVWIPVGLRDLSADVRFAFRLMWRERAFTATAVSTLALAIGMSNTVYTVVNAMILRGLPVAHPDRIVMFNDGSPNSQVLNVSYRDVEDWRAATASFAEIGLFRTRCSRSAMNDARPMWSVAATSPLPSSASSKSARCSAGIFFQPTNRRALHLSSSSDTACGLRAMAATRRSSARRCG